MKIFIKIIFFLTLSLSIQLLPVQADEDFNSEDTYITSNSVTFIDDIKNKVLTLHTEEKISSKNDNEALETFNSNNIPISNDDVYLMSQIVYAESKGEPYEGKVAVASVILNRVLDPKFPDTIYDVIFQPKAFSCVIDGKIDVTPTEECFSAVNDAISGIDPTNNAVFYYNPDIATCTWMHNAPKTDKKEIGQHLFFKIQY